MKKLPYFFGIMYYIDRIKISFLHIYGYHLKLVILSRFFMSEKFKRAQGEKLHETKSHNFAPLHRVVPVSLQSFYGNGKRCGCERRRDCYCFIPTFTSIKQYKSKVSNSIVKGNESTSQINQK